MSMPNSAGGTPAGRSDGSHPSNDDLDLYTIGGYIPISGEWARQMARGEPIVLWVGGFEDEDDDDAE